MNFAAFVLFVVAVTFSKTFVDATMCQPLSTFKIDCDECRCSEDGTEYSCTTKQCGPTSIRDADDKDSYVLDSPSSPDDPEDETIEFAYLNDDIQSSTEKEEDVLNAGDDDGGLWFLEDDSSESLEDGSLEKEDASVIDTGLLDSYRNKRYVRSEKRYVRPHVRGALRPIRVHKKI